LVLVISCSILCLGYFKIEKTTNILPFVLFSSFHLLYLVTYFTLGFFSTIPLVGLVSIIVLIIDLVIEYFILDRQALFAKLSYSFKNSEKL